MAPNHFVHMAKMVRFLVMFPSWNQRVLSSTLMINVLQTGTKSLKRCQEIKEVWTGWENWCLFLHNFWPVVLKFFFSGREIDCEGLPSTILGIFPHELLSDLRLSMLGSPKILSLLSLATLEATRVKGFLY